ncbi:MAG TPA: septum formation initiator family protein [Anaerolineaceae bacterium]
MKAFGINRNQLLIIIIFFVLILFGLSLRVPLNENYQLGIQRDHLTTQIAQLTATKHALSLQITNASSDKAVDDFARNNHMIKPGDVRIVAVSGGKPTPQPTPTPIPPLPAPENWEVWWALFFGK